MKAFFSFCVICSFFILNKAAFANNLNSSSKDKANIKQPEDKSSLKISERRSLKKTQIEQEEVSSFSMEELRVGAQKILDKSEIQYFKSQCRYAFMSDRDVIINRCETKKVSTPK